MICNESKNGANDTRIGMTHSNLIQRAQRSPFHWETQSAHHVHHQIVFQGQNNCVLAQKRILLAKIINSATVENIAENILSQDLLCLKKRKENTEHTPIE